MLDHAPVPQRPTTRWNPCKCLFLWCLVPQIVLCTIFCLQGGVGFDAIFDAIIGYKGTLGAYAAEDVDPFLALQATRAVKSHRPSPGEEALFEDIYEKLPKLLDTGVGGGQRDIFDKIVKRGATVIGRKQNHPFTLMEVGVWMGAGLARWLVLFPGCRVIGVDTFDEPLDDDDKMQALPFQQRRLFNETPASRDFRVRHVEYVFNRRAGATAVGTRSMLLRGSLAETAVSALQWPSLQVDAVFMKGGMIFKDSAKCVLYLIATFNAALANNAEVVIGGGDDWVRHTCLRNVVLAFAAEMDLQTVVLGNRAWAMSKDLTWLQSMNWRWTTLAMETPETYLGPKVAEIVREAVKSMAPEDIIVPDDASGFETFRAAHIHPYPAGLLQDKTLHELYNGYPEVLSETGGCIEFFDLVVRKGAGVAFQERRPFTLMDTGVRSGLGVLHWLGTHPNCRVISLDPFDFPRANDTRLSRLPTPLRLQFAETPLPELRMRLAEYVVRRGGHSPLRFVLLRGEAPDDALPVLAWEGLTIDAFYMSGVPPSSQTKCAAFFDVTFTAFLKHNPKAIIGGDGWHRFPCLRTAVRKVALDKGFQLMVSGKSASLLVEVAGNGPCKMGDACEEVGLDRDV